MSVDHQVEVLCDELDSAVLDPYGWPTDPAGGELLERVLASNLKRAVGSRIAGRDSGDVTAM